MNNPDVIEIRGTPTIIKLAKFATTQGMERCTWTEIVDQLILSYNTDKKLDSPARVGGVVFHKNIAWKSVIECAQRHYAYGLQKSKLSPNIATKILTGELELLPHEPTQEIYRLFMEGFESSEGENFAQKFKDGYRTMISAGVLDDE